VETAGKANKKEKTVPVKPLKVNKKAFDKVLGKLIQSKPIPRNKNSSK